MTELEHINKLAADYADAASRCAEDIDTLKTALATLKKKSTPIILKSAARAKLAKDALIAAIESRPDLFVKPKSRRLHGVKLGFAKRKGKVSWDDETKVIERIRAKLPKDQVELLIRTKENVHKPSVYDLALDDLKRLGITVTDNGEGAFAKLDTLDIEKLVEAVLRGDDEDEAEE